MRIEIIDKNGDLVTSYEMESCPFKVGETLHINVVNNDKTKWDIKELRGSFQIEKIEHSLRKFYNPNDVYTYFCVSVEVYKID
jgi:hypothetical protein